MPHDVFFCFFFSFSSFSFSISATYFSISSGFRICNGRFAVSSILEGSPKLGGWTHPHRTQRLRMAIYLEGLVSPHDCQFYVLAS